MFTGLQVKLIAAVVLLIAMAGAIAWFGAHERGIGAAKVQARWDAVSKAQATVAAKADVAARVKEHRQATDFAGIASSYLQATTHDYPSVANTLPAAVAAGAVQLRDNCPATRGGDVPGASAASRERDAAATQALADRVEAAVAAVRAGEQADARERQLGAQVTALQALLNAERKP